MIKSLKKVFSRNIIIQILQYFSIIIATIILFYGVFYIIYSSHFDGYVEQFKGVRTITVILKDMLGVECATILPVVVPFIIVLGYIRSKRIYIPITAVILFASLLLFIFHIYSIGIFIVYLIEIIFGVLLAYFLKFFWGVFNKLENKKYDILIYLLKIVLIVIIYFFIFYVVYFMFFISFISIEVSYFYERFSYDYPPIAPYYLYSLSIILSFFLGINKKYLTYNGILITVLSFLLLYNNIGQFSYDITRLYLGETFALNDFFHNLFLEWRYNDTLLFLLTFFSSSFLIISIFKIISNNHIKKQK